MNSIPYVATGCLKAFGLIATYVQLQHKIAVKGENENEVPVEIKKRVSEFANSMGIRQNVKVSVNSMVAKINRSPALAMGFNSLRSEPAIFFGDIKEYSTVQLCSMGAHELAHIKNNDALRNFTIAGVALTALALYPHKCRGFFGMSFAMCRFVAVTNLVSSLFMRSRERIADLDAINHMNKREQASYLKFFINELSGNEFNRQMINKSDMGFLYKKFNNLTISSAGNNLLDLSHPLLTTRIKYVKDAYYGNGELLPLEFKVDGDTINLDGKIVSKIRTMIRNSGKEDAFIDMVNVAIDTSAKDKNVKVETLDIVAGNYKVTIPSNFDKNSPDFDSKIIELFNNIFNKPEQTILICTLEKKDWDDLQSNNDDLNNFTVKIRRIFVKVTWDSNLVVSCNNI